MTFEEFNVFQANLLNDVRLMAGTKGREYAQNDSEDRFGNFNRIAATLHDEPHRIGYVYLVKHLDAIGSYMKRGHVVSGEPIRGRIIDAITYLTLIAGMIKEKERGQDDTKLP